MQWCWSLSQSPSSFLHATKTSFLDDPWPSTSIRRQVFPATENSPRIFRNFFEIGILINCCHCSYSCCIWFRNIISGYSEILMIFRNTNIRKFYVRIFGHPPSFSGYFPNLLISLGNIGLNWKESDLCEKWWGVAKNTCLKMVWRL